MSNLPVKPLQSRETPVAKAVDAASVPAEAAKSDGASAGGEAISVSLPRTQSKNVSPNDPASALESLLKGLKSSGDVNAAHGGLDAARVFGLLDDDESDPSK